MIEVKTYDNKEVEVKGEDVKAIVVGNSVVVQKGNEVCFITPITNIVTLWKGEE